MGVCVLSSLLRLEEAEEEEEKRCMNCSGAFVFRCGGGGGANATGETSKLVELELAWRVSAKKE